MLPNSRSFGLHFCRRQHESNFNYVDVIGPKATEFGKLTLYNWRFRRSRSFKVTDFGSNLYNNTHLYNNIHPISLSFQVIADYWSNFRCRQGMLILFNTLVQGERLNLGL